MVGKCVGCGQQIQVSEVACKACMSVPPKPCYRCESRVASPNCHDTCRRYLIRVSVDRALKDRARVAVDADMVSHSNRDRCIKRRHRKVKIRPKGDYRG